MGWLGMGWTGHHGVSCLRSNGIAMGVVNFLSAMGLFLGQPPAFFELLHDLAEDADKVRRRR
jgi:hypothetical protein